VQLLPPALRASASLLLATGLHSTADSRTKAHLHILSVKQLVDEVLLGLREKERPPAGEVKHASRCNAAGAARAGNAGMKWRPQQSTSAACSDHFAPRSLYVSPRWTSSSIR
jgi:hypothetical protein